MMSKTAGVFLAALLAVITVAWLVARERSGNEFAQAAEFVPEVVLTHGVPIALIVFGSLLANRWFEVPMVALTALASGWAAQWLRLLIIFWPMPRPFSAIWNGMELETPSIT